MPKKSKEEEEEDVEEQGAIAAINEKEKSDIPGDLVDPTEITENEEKEISDIIGDQSANNIEEEKPANAEKKPRKKKSDSDKPGKEKKAEEAPKIVKPIASFEAKIKNLSRFTKIIDIVSSLLDETEWIFDENGMKIIALDKSHICLVDLIIKKEYMISYTPPPIEGGVTIGLNMLDTIKVFKRATSADSLTLSLDTKNRRLVVGMRPEKAKKERIFNVALIDVETTPIQPESIEEYDSQHEFIISSQILSEAVKDAAIFSETLQFAVDKGDLTIKAAGNVGDMCYKLGKEEIKKIIKTGESATNDTFSIQYLTNIMKLGTLNDDVNVAIIGGSPMRYMISLKEDEKSNDESRLYIVLAPRIDDEDDGDKNDDDD